MLYDPYKKPLNTMSESKPTVYLLHGDDHFGITSFIDGLITKMGNPDDAQMNISRFQVGVDSEDVIKSACLAIPFLTDRRLIILSGYDDAIRKLDADIGRETEARKRREGLKQETLDFLSSIPQSTALLLVIEDEWVRERGAWGWKTLPLKHWLLTWSEGNTTTAYYRLFSLPRGRDMVTWIKNQAQKMGGQITPAATQALMDAIGNDTQMVHHELEKLFTYVNRQRAIDLPDVERLTTPVIQESVFEMADAIGRRDSRRALDALHDLLTESSIEELIGMIVRQFRLLLLVKEALGTSMTVTEMSGLVKLPAGIVEKYINQARGYSLTELKGVYRRLLALDISNKTGQMPPEVALDTFIVSLAS
jgi:DNA polymerase-3 subunit delta